MREISREVCYLLEYMAKTASVTPTPSREILEVALHGLETQRERLDGQISEVRRLLSGRGSANGAARPVKTAAKSGSSNSGARSGRRKRALSAEARARIAAAQKKRWAAFRKSQG